MTFKPDYLFVYFSERTSWIEMYLYRVLMNIADEGYFLYGFMDDRTMRICPELWTNSFNAGRAIQYVQNSFGAH